MGNLYYRRATISADAQWELPAGLDLTQFRTMTLVVNLIDAGSGAANKLDVKLQQRWQDLNWIDRIHATQFDGGQAAARLQYTIEAEVLIPSGDQGAMTALAENTVRHGPFPPVVYAEQPNPGGQANAKSPVTNCRIDLDVTVDSGPSFDVEIVLLGTGLYPVL